MLKLEGFFFHDFPNSYVANILKEIYLDKVYEPFLLGKKDQIIVDVGANVGLTAYYFKDFGKVFAVEPSRVHLQAIDEMVSYNSIQNIVVAPFALSNMNTPTYFFHNHNKTMYSLDPRLASLPNETEMIMALDMEALFKALRIDRIDFLKLDPEGAEGDIVSSDAFKKMSPLIKTIVGELHAWNLLSKEQFKAKFEELGYKFTWISEKDAQLYSATR